MKNIFKSFLFAVLTTGIISCEKEDNFEYLTQAADFKIVTPETGSSILNNDIKNNPAMTITWEKANFGNPTQVNYVVEICKAGANFVGPDVDVSNGTTNTNITLTVEQLNAAAKKATLLPFVQGGLDIRIKASVGTGTDLVKYSNVITYLVVPYTNDKPRLTIRGNHQGWQNDQNGPFITASAFGETDFEGFVYLTDEYKFLAANQAGEFLWGNQDWGDVNASFSGTLTDTNENNCKVSAPGYYRIKANTKTTGTGALTYATDLTNWGIIGAATPNGWGSSTPLTYNATTKKWEGTMTLTAGEYKFRANQEWAINLGKDNNNDDSMDYDGPNLSVAAGGSYKVELDLSNPRKYKHTLTLQ